MYSLAPRANLASSHRPDDVLGRIFAPSPILGHDVAEFARFDYYPDSHNDNNDLPNHLTDLSPLERVSNGVPLSRSNSRSKSLRMKDKWSRPFLRVTRLRETKKSTPVSVHHPLGHHGSIRVKTQSTTAALPDWDEAPSPASSSDDDMPYMPGGDPDRPCTPLCTKIARSTSTKHDHRPRRKPAPRLDTAHAHPNPTCIGGAAPPPRPPKSALRPAYVCKKEAREPVNLPALMAGGWAPTNTTTIRTNEQTAQLSDTDMPALISDSETDSLSSVDP